MFYRPAHFLRYSDATFDVRCRFVEAAYGYWSNSLSLIADSGVVGGGCDVFDDVIDDIYGDTCVNH